MTINKVTLIGNVGKDPEIRLTKDGKEVASFSFATSESWKDRTGEYMSKTEWHNIAVLNDGLAKIVKNHVKKGCKLYVEGMIQTKEWVDKKGEKRYSKEIIVKNFDGTIKLLDKKEDNNFESKKNLDNAENSVDPQFIDDEIPF